MKRVGLVGWRGMVGSVLLDRMRIEGDFEGIEPVFFSTSQAGQVAPDVGQGDALLLDAGDLSALASCDLILTCQGGDWTKSTYPGLRAQGWSGHWIDAASALRMANEAVIVLDPLNLEGMKQALSAGGRTWVGGNCTVSLMLMGLGALFQRGWVQWMTSMTYQAASGAGARNMRELVAQMNKIGDDAKSLLDDPATAALTLDSQVSASLKSRTFPAALFGAPLAASVLPWIDTLQPDGSTREEWKGHVEANKILGLQPEVPIDGLCVRVGAMRSHAQAVTVKLNRDIPLADIEALLAESTPWTSVIPNDKAQSLSRLTPAAVSGTLDIPVGRLRKLRMGPEFLGAFTVGDQLLWGAAEPLRRTLRWLLESN
ncbi:MAG TPA: aspartate-semialdehyde dehydrogenase [Myxococcales bacterium]|nr:aspartate-semialdehyde dehydrogenase [Myxococcales bacterium]HAN30634.1 aspartate-semialdehyde dehydrogenase [Myxococcales bacterium]